MNNVFFFAEQSNLWNLADDNILYTSGKNEQAVVKKIMQSCNRIIGQRKVNSLPANPKIFHVMFIGKMTNPINSLMIYNAKKKSKTTVTLWGLEIDI